MSSVLLPKKLLPAVRRQTVPIRVSPLLLEIAALPPERVYERLASRQEGMTDQEAADCLAREGPNILTTDGRKSRWLLLWHAILNPLVLLLATLATISVATGDLE